MTSRLVLDLCGLTFETRLDSLMLFSRQCQRARGDSIQIYKLINRLLNVPVESFFKLQPALSL